MNQQLRKYSSPLPLGPPSTPAAPEPGCSWLCDQREVLASVRQPHHKVRDNRHGQTLKTILTGHTLCSGLQSATWPSFPDDLCSELNSSNRYEDYTLIGLLNQPPQLCKPVTNLSTYLSIYLSVSLSILHSASLVEPWPMPNWVSEAGRYCNKCLKMWKRVWEQQEEEARRFLRSMVEKA